MYFTIAAAYFHFLIGVIGQTTPPPAFGIPATLTWDLVLAGIADLLANGIVQAGIVFVLALRFGPRVVKALMSATRSR